ncbi:MAG: exosortase/archaeosortase family protein [Kiritimatiellae bacterium]|nr:exosortase/archaeosortase family protein [Kiritimatiellia bacterium]MDW8457623.1 archaeosortase/exosortase family protein [Verrucomicrobiota bacterium]
MMKSVRQTGFMTLGLLAAGTVFVLAWGIFFHFRGVTDVGYIVSKPNPSIFYWLYDRWWLNDFVVTSYAINFLAPILAAFLAWRRRTALRDAPRRIGWAGLVLFTALLALHVLGARAQQTRISILAMVWLPWAAAFFAWGPAVARLLAYPFLMASWIMPVNFFDAAMNPLRVAAAHAAAGLAAGIGFPATAVGSAIVESESQLWVINLSDSTSGIYALSALAMFTMLAADYVKPLRRAVWTVVLTPVFFWLANTGRGFLAVFVAEVFGPNAANTLNVHYPAVGLIGFYVAAQAAWLRLSGLDWGSVRRRFLEPHEARTRGPWRPSSGDTL